MLVAVGFRPPHEFVAALAAGVGAAADAVREEPVPAERHGWLRRQARPVPPSGPDLVLAEDPLVLVTRFGNLTPDDYVRVLETLTAAADAWAPAVVRAAAVRFGTSEDPLTVRAELSGDIAALDQVSREVALRAADLNLYVDRRLFRPVLAVATLAEDTTDAQREALAQQRLGGVADQAWTVDHLSVLRQTFDGTHAGYVEVKQIPFVACS